MIELSEYSGINDRNDPIRFYRLPFIGNLFRRRVEKCLKELSGGHSVLEVGFGSGVTFLHLNDMYNEIHGLDLTANVEAITERFQKLGVMTYLSNGDILNMPYQDSYFDSVLLISILEHLKPEFLYSAFLEISRVLKQNGQVIYGVPIDKKIMDYAFRYLGYNIREYHFSNHKQISEASEVFFKRVSISNIYVFPFGSLYEVCHWEKG